MASETMFRDTPRGFSYCANVYVCVLVYVCDGRNCRDPRNKKKISAATGRIWSRSRGRTSDDRTSSASSRYCLDVGALRLRAWALSCGAILANVLSCYSSPHPSTPRPVQLTRRNSEPVSPAGGGHLGPRRQGSGAKGLLIDKRCQSLVDMYHNTQY